MRINILVILVILFCGFSCEDVFEHGYYIKVQNNTVDTLWCYASLAYPDTSLSINKPLLQRIDPLKHTKLDSKEKWDDLLPSNTVIIFSNDTIKKYSWEEIRSDNKILKRYDLDLKGLEMDNWTVIYP